MQSIHRVAAMGALAALAACSSTEPNTAATSDVTLDVATIAAERGLPSSTLISPKWSPGPNVATDSSLIRASAEPLTVVC